MNKKNKLMKALVGLELSNKAKQEFCDIVLDKSNNESDGGGAGAESTMEYLDVSGVTMESFMQDNLLNAGYFANIEVEQMGRIRAVPAMYSQGITPQKVYSVAIDLNHGYVAQGQELTGRNAMINGGWTNEQIDSLPRLTADEFYKWALEA